MSVFLVIVAILVVGFGLLSLSEATMGVGIIATGCFIAILARLSQAAEYQRAPVEPKAQTDNSA